MRIKYFLVCIAAGFILSGAEMPEVNSNNLAWIKKMTREYSPDSWHLLMEYDRLPDKAKLKSPDGWTVSSRKTAGTFKYLKGGSKESLIDEMSTNIHEIAHAFHSYNVFEYVKNNRINFEWDNIQSFQYLSRGETYFLSFPEASVFPSKELIGEIPSALRTFRFPIYIRGLSSTQGSGIFGLLDELNAYYLGSRFAVDMLPAWKEISTSEGECLIHWVQGAQSSLTAFYEFDFFMHEYLLFMKKNYPTDYRKLNEYMPFRETYEALILSYKALIKRYEETLAQEVHRFNESDIGDAALSEGKLYVKMKGSNVSRSTSYFSNDRKTLLQVLQSNRYDEITNDFSFLKII